MLNIFICEDSQEQRKEIENILQEHIAQKGYKATIVLSTGNPDVLLDYVYRNDINGGLFVFDIDLGHPTINGIDAAIEVRKLLPSDPILFITTHEEMSYLTFRYKINVADFIVKDEIDQIPDRLRTVLDNTYHNYANPKDKPETFLIKHQNGTVENVLISSIMFFEAHHLSHKIILHTENGRTEFYGTLDKVEDTSEHFFRAHRSNVINVKNVKTVDKTLRKIEMVNGEIAVVAGRKISKLLELIS